MDRRTFIGTLAGGLLAAPLAAGAQPAPRNARIGYLATNLATTPHLQDAFRQGLRDLGYVEGRNLVIEIPICRGEVRPARRSCGRTGCAQH
jgi:putative ABC transport system substrate-binding protein